MRATNNIHYEIEARKGEESCSDPGQHVEAYNNRRSKCPNEDFPKAVESIAPWKGFPVANGSTVIFPFWEQQSCPRTLTCYPFLVEYRFFWTKGTVARSLTPCTGTGFMPTRESRNQAYRFSCLNNRKGSGRDLQGS